MIKQFQLCIVIPCYNEEKRLETKRIDTFLKSHENVLLCLVNDGSSDDTLNVLQGVKSKFPENITVVDTVNNVGKAEAVRLGFSHCDNHFNYDKIAYLDADFATTLEECLEISNYIKNEVVFAFGSRIAKIDNHIQRKQSRFLIGRVIATFISKQLNLVVYDTQCGCKIFHHKLASQIFAEKFISKWLFDVELFHRIIKIYGRDKMGTIAREIPLKSWIDQGDSRVKLSYFFKLWYDLYVIGKTYKSVN